MNIIDLLKKNIVMIPVIASLVVGTFTGVRYIVSLTETINKNKAEIVIINDTHLKNQIGYIARIQENQSHLFAYTEITARLTSLETSRELFQADLLKKSEQLPTDQEQYMLIEDLYKTTEKLEITQEQNMTNKVNIEFLKAQLEKALADVEELKDKVRANGSHD